MQEPGWLLYVYKMGNAPPMVVAVVVVRVIVIDKDLFPHVFFPPLLRSGALSMGLGHTSSVDVLCIVDK